MGIPLGVTMLPARKCSSQGRSGANKDHRSREEGRADAAQVGGERRPSCSGKCVRNVNSSRLEVWGKDALPRRLSWS